VITALATGAAGNTRSVFAAVFVLSALVVAGFFVNLKVRERIDNPRTPEEVMS
jgi:hypothetical protein